MNNFYVDINNSYTTSGTGINSNPYNYDQFLDHISSGLNQNTTYFIDGVRTLGYQETSDIYVNVLEDDIQVILTNKLKSPWMLTAFSVQNNENKISINTGNVNDNVLFKSPSILTIQNAVFALDENDLYFMLTDQIKFNNIDGKLDVILNIDNIYIEAID